MSDGSKWSATKNIKVTIGGCADNEEYRYGIKR